MEAALSATLFAELMVALDGFSPDRPPLPNPPWVAWDYGGPGEFPPHPWMDAGPNQGPLPGFLQQTADRARARLRHVNLPRVVGHADWEAQNLRWLDGTPHVVHDWDSVAYMPEAALAGAAAGAFASNEVPALAPLESSEAFLIAYQARRGRRFSTEETEVAWAASLWTAVHNARAEYRCGTDAVAGRALALQYRERLARAGA